MTWEQMERAIEFLTEQGASQSAKLDRMIEEGREQSARIEGLTRNLDKVIEAINKDAENIRGLARIAEVHNQRLARLEGETGK
jgi:hypothetical protein